VAIEAGRGPAEPDPAPDGGGDRGADGLRPWTDHLPPGGQQAREARSADGTLVHAFLRRWADAPDDRLWLEPDGGRWWTNGAFEEATRGAAGRLLAAGLEPGDRVLWSAAPSVEALVSHVACLRAGLVVVPANPAYSEPELASVVAGTRPRGAILDQQHRAGWVRRAASGPVVVTDTAVDLPSSAVAAEAIDQVGPEDPALIGVTSGTTGAPKGALLRQRHLLAGAASLGVAWRWTAEDRLLHCLPLFHSHGLCVGAYGTMVAGGSAVLMGGFDPKQVAESAGRDKATLFFGVPTMYHRLVNTGEIAGLRRLRLCVSGSAPLPAALHEEASSVLGAPVLERYGMTETLMITSNPYDGDRRPGTVGFPLPGVEVRLARVGDSPADGADGNSDGDGDGKRLGEVLVRGPSVFDGYIGHPRATVSAFLDAHDGGRPWFRTGDLGATEDGSLVLRGRSKELIISGGYNVHPVEVEEALAGCPGVAEVAVAGAPSDEWGEVVTAWVVADGRAPTLEDLSRFAAGSLARYKWPRRLHVVDELPRNAMGKLVRTRLGGEDGGDG
jgi:malonyl-CoA/methylmalonyl-CoA synthetase